MFLEHWFKSVNTVNVYCYYIKNVKCSLIPKHIPGIRKPNESVVKNGIYLGLLCKQEQGSSFETNKCNWCLNTDNDKSDKIILTFFEEKYLIYTALKNKFSKIIGFVIFFLEYCYHFMSEIGDMFF